MSIIKYNNIGISAMAACLPKQIINNYKYTQYFPEEDVKHVVDKIGVYERRFVKDTTCSSDLCFAAAEKLIADNNVNREDINLLVFVSQTADYKMPATSIILQNRLGLSNGTIAFDVNLGCSGFIFALSIVYSFMQNNGIKKALLLDGETRSKVYSPKDRKSAFLFGDAGVAVLVERDCKYGESSFSLNTDGSRADLIMIKGGGYRHPSSIDTLKEKVVDEYGNIRSDEQGYMNGSDVFNFVVKEIPRDIKSLLSNLSIDMNQIDYYVFHQANEFINNYLAKKMKLDKDKMPSTIHKYGNTSSVSVPLTIISELQNKLQGNKKLLLSAFGVGMAWASALVPFVDCKISDLVEID